MSDVVVVGAGIIGAACAYYAGRAGLRVSVVDRAGVAGGTSGAGEGNILVSDKAPGPELDLALRSNQLWLDIGEELDGIELERKGGLMVAATAEELAALHAFARSQQGVVTTPVDPARMRELEPNLAADLPGGVFYPQDLQVQPMLAAAHLLRASGARLLLGTTVREIHPGRVVTDQGDLVASTVVNAAGAWAGSLSGLPIQPRRGFILTTGRQPPDLVRHKVYQADYLASVASDQSALSTSPVIESTRSGTILIGSSRERVGFDPTMSLPVLARLAAGAIRLIPALAGVPVIRAYKGFRPFTPDHLPVIGADPRLSGVFHACGHEGAGVGLAPITGRLIADLITGATPVMDMYAFRADRFHDVHL